MQVPTITEIKRPTEDVEDALEGIKKPSIFKFQMLLVLLLAGCGSDEPRKNIPNVSNIKVTLNLQRFDRDLFALDTNQLEAGLTTLAQQHPDFLPFFLQEVAHDQSNLNETPLAALTGFVKAPQVRRLQDSCTKAFPDLRDVEKSLTQMLRYHKHYFPERPAPRFVAAVTEFVGDAYAVNDSLLMIGLDMFLGERFSGYNPDFFPQYLRRQFEPPYLPAKVALALASRIVGPPPGERVIDYMINNGKILYVTDLLLPEIPDTLKLAYTAAQLEGCYTNEATLWARLLDMNVLYDPLGPRNQKIVMPGPSSDNVFQEAPGEIGNWVGWRIVQAYMRRRPQTTVQDLLRLREAQQILTEARYKPR